MIMKKSACVLVALTLLACIWTEAQQEKQNRKPLTNADVVDMVKAGLAESTIVLSISHSATNFDTSPQALIALKNQGVPQKVLDSMLDVGTDKATSSSKSSGGTATGDKVSEEQGSEESRATDVRKSDTLNPADTREDNTLVRRFIEAFRLPQFKVRSGNRIDSRQVDKTLETVWVAYNKLQSTPRSPCSSKSRAAKSSRLRVGEN
jgi:hypothetical protein